jgi:hypothetical protein
MQDHTPGGFGGDGEFQCGCCTLIEGFQILFAGLYSSRRIQLTRIARNAEKPISPRVA